MIQEDNGCDVLVGPGSMSARDVTLPRSQYQVTEPAGGPPLTLFVTTASLALHGVRVVVLPDTAGCLYLLCHCQQAAGLQAAPLGLDADSHSL